MQVRRGHNHDGDEIKDLLYINTMAMILIISHGVGQYIYISVSFVVVLPFIEERKQGVVWMCYACQI